jgi:glycine/D-amino acid oxidase-like deaminating enzyme
MTRVDVAVLGGGLVGCATAYYLSRAGARVVLVEQADLNREASGRNAGSLHFQLEYRLLSHGDELAAQFSQIIPLSLLAIEDWAGLEKTLESDLEVEFGGGLIVADSAADVTLLEKRQALQSKWGLPSRLLSRAEVRQLAPYLADSVVAAGYCAAEGHANPRLVTPAFARRAAENGADIQCRTRVTALARDGRDWRVATVATDGTQRDIIAGAVLNAAGAWASDIATLAHLHLPIYAVPLTMNVIERTAPMIPHLVQHASRRLSLKQVAAGNILVGGGWPGRFQCEDSTPNVCQRADLVLDHVAANVSLASRLVPALGRLHLLRSWTGTTGVTADQMPLLGEVPEAPRFFVAAGGSAFTHGPTYARLISEAILEGRSSAPIDLYSPARFSHINNFMASA